MTMARANKLLFPAASAKCERVMRRWYPVYIGLLWTII